MRLLEPKPYAVYQRGVDHSAEVTLSIAEAPAVLSIQWRIQGDEDWEDLNYQQSQVVVTASVRLSAGGWYCLELRIVDITNTTQTLLSEPVGVGEVFITAGQSNAANFGEPSQQTQTNRVAVFDGDLWELANDPIPVCDGEGGSIWPLLGDDLSQALGVPVGFLCLAIGGTCVSEWSRRNYLSQVEQRKLYGRFKEYVPRLMPYGWRGLLWHQGESDRLTEQAAYYDELKDVIVSFREDFGDSPWMVAIVGNSWSDPSNGIGCRPAQLQLISEGMALMGPDTDVLGKEYRLHDESSHFNQRGLQAHAALWSAAIQQQLLYEYI